MVSISIKQTHFVADLVCHTLMVSLSRPSAGEVATQVHQSWACHESVMRYSGTNQPWVQNTVESHNLNLERHCAAIVLLGTVSECDDFILWPSFHLISLSLPSQLERERILCRHPLDSPSPCHDYCGYAISAVPWLDIFQFHRHQRYVVISPL